MAPPTPGEVPEDHVGHDGAPTRDVALRAHVDPEDSGKRVLGGDVEHTEGRDRLVDFHGVDVRAEGAVPLAALQNSPERVDDRSVQRAHHPRFLQVAAPDLVLGHDQPNEPFVIEVVIVGECDDAPDRVRRTQVGEVEAILRVSDVAVHVLQDGEVDLLFAAEVVVDERARGTGARRDRVHTRSFEPAGGEFRDGGVQDARPIRRGRLRLAHGRAHGPRISHRAEARRCELTTMLNWPSSAPDAIDGSETRIPGRRSMSRCHAAEAVPEPSNPLGLDGIEFIEYATAQPQAFGALLQQMGFAAVARHRSREVVLYGQGGMNVIVNSHGAATGPPVLSAMALRVRDAGYAYRHSVDLGAWELEPHAAAMELNIPGIRGVGDSLVYFVDRYRDFSIYDVDFVPLAGTERRPPALAGLHWFGVVQAIRAERTRDWLDFYGGLFAFSALPHGRYFGVLPNGTLLESPCHTFYRQLIEPPSGVDDWNEGLVRVGL